MIELKEQGDSSISHKIIIVMIVLILATPLFCFLSIYMNAYLVPVICIIPAYPVMAYLLKKRERKLALLLMVLWTFLLGASMSAVIYLHPEAAKYRILNGENYSKQMMEWVLTGVGKEGEPLQFIPTHILELIVFVILSLLTGSFLSMLMGVVFMNYMAYYVAHLASLGSGSALFIAGWHPWSIMRIISYIFMGVVLSEPALSRLLRYEYHFKNSRRLLYIALGLWMIDIIMKALLAPAWQNMLKSMIEK